MERSELVTEITKMLNRLNDRYLEIIYHTIKKLLEQG